MPPTDSFGLNYVPQRRQATVMGGTVIIIHPNWRHAMVRAKADKSGLSIITKVTFKIASSIPNRLEDMEGRAPILHFGSVFR